jgi:DNA repair exonuclease SbcCD ATPase subunit
MPEITSVQRIQEKLRDFEVRVDGAIVAANALVRIKTDADGLLARITATSTKGDQFFERLELSRRDLQQLHNDCIVVKAQVDGVLADAVKARDSVLREVGDAIRAIDGKLNAAEERLKKASRESLADHAQLLTRLDASTKSNAEIAERARGSVDQATSRIDELLQTLRDELQDEVRAKLTGAEQLLESEVERIEKYLTLEQSTSREQVEKRIGSHERSAQEEMAAFKEDVKRGLAEQKRGIDREITEFLDKQNRLVENLTQQIDSYARLSQVQSAELTAANAKLAAFESSFREFQSSSERSRARETETANAIQAQAVEIATANKKLAELFVAFREHKLGVESQFVTFSAALSEIKLAQSKFDSQSARVDAAESSLRDTAEQLNQTIDKLKQLPWPIGAKFK